MARPRRTIKRPARFDEDDFSTSTHRRNPHTIPLFPELMAERVVPYHSGHPPAAFPSLPFGPSDPGLDGAHSSKTPADIDQTLIELDQESAAIQVDPEYQTILPRAPSADEGAIDFVPDHRACGEKIGSHTQRKIETHSANWQTLGIAIQYQIFSTISSSESYLRTKELLRLTDEQYEDIKQVVTERAIYPARYDDIYSCALLASGPESNGVILPEVFEFYAAYLVFARKYEYTSKREVENARLFLRKLDLPDNSSGAWIPIETDAMDGEMKLEYVDTNLIVEEGQNNMQSVPEKIPDSRTESSTALGKMNGEVSSIKVVSTAKSPVFTHDIASGCSVATKASITLGVSGQKHSVQKALEQDPAPVSIKKPPTRLKLVLRLPVQLYQADQSTGTTTTKPVDSAQASIASESTSASTVPQVSAGTNDKPTPAKNVVSPVKNIKSATFPVQPESTSLEGAGLSNSSVSRTDSSGTEISPGEPPDEDADSATIVVQKRPTSLEATSLPTAPQSGTDSIETAVEQPKNEAQPEFEAVSMPYSAEALSRLGHDPSLFSTYFMHPQFPSLKRRQILLKPRTQLSVTEEWFAYGDKTASVRSQALLPHTGQRNEILRALLSARNQWLRFIEGTDLENHPFDDIALEVLEMIEGLRANAGLTYYLRWKQFGRECNTVFEKKRAELKGHESEGKESLEDTVVLKPKTSSAMLTPSFQPEVPVSGRIPAQQPVPSTPTTLKTTASSRTPQTDASTITVDNPNQPQSLRKNGSPKKKSGPPKGTIYAKTRRKLEAQAKAATQAQVQEQAFKGVPFKDVYHEVQRVQQVRKERCVKGDRAEVGEGVDKGEADQKIEVDGLRKEGQIKQEDGMGGEEMLLD